MKLEDLGEYEIEESTADPEAQPISLEDLGDYEVEGPSYAGAPTDGSIKYQDPAKGRMRTLLDNIKQKVAEQNAFSGKGIKEMPEGTMLDPEYRAKVLGGVNKLSDAISAGQLGINTASGLAAGAIAPVLAATGATPIPMSPEASIGDRTSELYKRMKNQAEQKMAAVPAWQAMATGMATGKPTSAALQDLKGLVTSFKAAKSAAPTLMTSAKRAEEASKAKGLLSLGGLEGGAMVADVAASSAMSSTDTGMDTAAKTAGAGLMTTALGTAGRVAGAGISKATPFLKSSAIKAIDTLWDIAPEQSQRYLARAKEIMSDDNTMTKVGGEIAAEVQDVMDRFKAGKATADELNAAIQKLDAEASIIKKSEKDVLDSEQTALSEQQFRQSEQAAAQEEAMKAVSETNLNAASTAAEEASRIATLAKEATTEKLKQTGVSDEAATAAGSMMKSIKEGLKEQAARQANSVKGKGVRIDLAPEMDQLRAGLRTFEGGEIHPDDRAVLDFLNKWGSKVNPTAEEALWMRQIAKNGSDFGSRGPDGVEYSGPAAAKMRDVYAAINAKMDKSLEGVSDYTAARGEIARLNNLQDMADNLFSQSDKTSALKGQYGEAIKKIGDPESVNGRKQLAELEAATGVNISQYLPEYQRAKEVLSSTTLKRQTVESTPEFLASKQASEGKTAAQLEMDRVKELVTKTKKLRENAQKAEKEMVDLSAGERLQGKLTPIEAEKGKLVPRLAEQESTNAALKAKEESFGFTPANTASKVRSTFPWNREKNPNDTQIMDKFLSERPKIAEKVKDLATREAFDTTEDMANVQGFNMIQSKIRAGITKNIPRKMLDAVRKLESEVGFDIYDAMSPGLKAATLKAMSIYSIND